MKKIIVIFLLIVLCISYLFNMYLDSKLFDSFSNIRLENIKNLEHESNHNFYKRGIENIGKNVQRELLDMNVEKCNIKVKNDLFYFFQEKRVYIRNNEKCIEINVKYRFKKSIFEIIGYKTL